MNEKLLKIKNNIIFKRIFGGLLLAFCLGVFYSFTTTPYTGDIEVFMASANQVKYQQSTGLMAVFETWELKGIFNRIVIYIIYRLTSLFVPYTNIVNFQIYSKFIYALFVTILLFISMMIIPDISMKQKISAGIALFLSIFATFTAVQMQAEMTIVVLGILVFSLLCTENKKLSIVGGIIGSFFFFSKSVFILLYFAIIICLFIFKAKPNVKNIIYSIASMIISEIILVIGIKLIYPQEFVDMKNAANFQTTLFSTRSNVSLITIITNFSNNFTQSCVAIPFLFISFICTLVLIKETIKEKNVSRLIAIAFSWLIPIDIIVASNTYFIYHFFLLMLPGVICMLVYILNHEISSLAITLAGIVSVVMNAGCWLLMDGLQQVDMINYSTCLLVIIHVAIIVIIFEASGRFEKYHNLVVLLALTVGCFFWMNYSSFLSPKYKNLVELTERSEEICKNAFPEDFGDEPVLFLDSGVVPFYVDAPSYSRYFFNLPLQRWSDGKNWKVKDDEYKKLMQYNGKYIVYTGWFGLDKYPELKAKIDSEYCVLANSGIWTHSPNWDVFALSSLPDVDSTNISSGTYILVNKKYVVTTNLLDSHLDSMECNGVHVNANGDGTYTVNGTASDFTTFTFNTYDIEKRGTYKLVGCIGGSIDTYYVDFRNDDGTQVIDTGDGALIKSGGQSGYECRLVVYEGAIFDNVIIKPMITSNTSATYSDYVQYE